MDLTIALLLPPKTLQRYEISWILSTIKDGKEVEWGMDYKINWDGSKPYKWDGPNLIPNSILVEHANGTNIKNETVCLPEGSYTFNATATGSHGGQYFDGLEWQGGLGVNNAWFILSSGEKSIACGDLNAGIEEPFTMTFQLPTNDDSELVGSCQVEDISGDIASFDTLLNPLQCYYSAFDYDLEECYFPIKTIDSEVWKNEECGAILADACEDGKALGFSDDDDMKDFCAYHQCVYQRDTLDFDFSQSQDARDAQCLCLELHWDCSHGSGCDQTKEKALNCCNDDGGDSCECILKPMCDNLNERCGQVAHYCCPEQDDSCKCEYHKKACIVSGVEGWSDIGGCGSADQYCTPECGGWGDIGYGPQFEYCERGCDQWSQICTKYPSPACDWAAGRCCGSPATYEHNPSCYCEFEQYTSETLNYQLEYTEACRITSMNSGSTSNAEEEMQVLVDMFNALNGNEWINNTGWQSDDKHCNWFGITCNKDGHVSFIDLRSNNLTGSFPSRLLSSLHGVEWLDLGDNEIFGTINDFLLYQMVQLQHVDLSFNDLSGSAQVLVTPSIQYLNFSHNKFNSIRQMQIFKQSYNTMHTIDLSYNNITTDISEVVENIPPNLKELLLTGNHIYGTLPNPLPVVENMRRFLVNNNKLSGQVPDISRSFPLINELRLSNQSYAENGGLSGSIPLGWSNLRYLDFLDLSYNKLNNVISPDIGNLPQLRVLNISNNELTGWIPTDLGNLAGILEIFDVSNNSLQGSIPTQLGSFDDVHRVILSGNDELYVIYFVLEGLMISYYDLTIHVSFTLILTTTTDGLLLL